MSEVKCKEENVRIPLCTFVHIYNHGSVQRVLQQSRRLESIDLVKELKYYGVHADVILQMPVYNCNCNCLYEIVIVYVKTK